MKQTKRHVAVKKVKILLNDMRNSFTQNSRLTNEPSVNLCIHYRNHVTHKRHHFWENVKNSNWNPSGSRSKGHQTIEWLCCYLFRALNRLTCSSYTCCLVCASWWWCWMLSRRCKGTAKELDYVRWRHKLLHLHIQREVICISRCVTWGKKRFSGNRV